MSKNDSAWQRYFDATDTLAQISRSGYAHVLAEDLTRFAGREPRLMAKQDTLSVRPSIFQKHNIAIFPTRNGQYILFHDPDQRSYFQFSSDDQTIPIEEYSSQIDLQAFDAYPGSQSLSESQAIDFAYVSSLLKTFTGAEALYLVIRGRLFSGSFQFLLPDTEHWTDVSSVQIEVDAGYESHDSIYLIEAKVGRRDNFHIRQLYYPYLEWSRRSRKRIVPIFLVYSNAKYYFHEFSFSDDFGDLRLLRSKGYVVNESPIATVSLSSITHSTVAEAEPDVPYPQGNDLDKVIDLVSLIDQGVATKTEIAEYFEFDDRQGDYYANAACYLGYLIRDDQKYMLTELGREFLAIRSSSMRNAAVVEQMLQRPSFRRFFEMLRDNDMQMSSLTNTEISEIIRTYTNLTGSTPGRRASTVRSWLQWVLNNVDLRP